MRWFRIHWHDRYNFTAAQLLKPTGKKATASNIVKWKKYVLREGHLYRNSYATKVLSLKHKIFPLNLVIFSTDRYLLDLLLVSWQLIL
jgi:hypothetical protein